jgi:hypothetical protein
LNMAHDTERATDGESNDKTRDSLIRWFIFRDSTPVHISYYRHPDCACQTTSGKQMIFSSLLSARFASSSAIHLSVVIAPTMISLRKILHGVVQLVLSLRFGPSGFGNVAVSNCVCSVNDLAGIVIDGTATVQSSMLMTFQSEVSQ